MHFQKVKGLGGSERHLLSLLPGLAARGVEVTMCVAATDGAERFVEPLRATGVETVVVDAGSAFNPRLLLSLQRELRRVRPDVLHTHLIHGDLHGQIAGRVGRVPGVSSVHGAHGLFRPQPLRGVAAGASALARRVIAISDYLRKTIVSRGLTAADRIRVVPYGIQAAEWSCSADDRNAARARFGIEPETVALGIASRVIPGKGHELLFDAFESVIPDTDHVRLYVAGDGPLLPALRRRATALPDGSAQCLGFVRDIRAFVTACDILVFPTLPELGEGFGLAALEAMAAGRPVIATDVASLPEVVEHDRTGLLVSPRHPAELAAALRALAADTGRRATMGRAGRQRARDVFGLDVMLDRTTSVYREVIEGADPRWDTVVR